MQSAYDASGYANFDLEAGIISSKDNQKLALMPLSLIAAMESSPALSTIAEELGKLHASKISDAASEMTMDDFSLNLQTAISLIGLGKISIELRNDALLFNIKLEEIQNMKTIKDVILGFLAGYLSAFYPQAQFKTVLLTEKTNELLVFAGNETAVEKVVAWSNDGQSPDELIMNLHKTGGAI
ncbi:MAG: hypothetical protein JXR91_15940 [Deltaproteobacteria bacterium]|nr:hypothetical protein [Deltaproteobacteria bacterium]